MKYTPTKWQRLLGMALFLGIGMSEPTSGVSASDTPLVHHHSFPVMSGPTLSPVKSSAAHRTAGKNSDRGERIGTGETESELPEELVTPPAIIMAEPARHQLERKALQGLDDESGAVLADIYFDEERSVLAGELADILNKISELLKTDKDRELHIEAHCDERATSSYNLALGDRRGRAIERYLINLGVSPAQVTTVSYGHEKPLCTGVGVTCWQDNRRLQSTFQMLAINHYQYGCLARVKLEKNRNRTRFTRETVRPPFLQRIHLAEPRRSLAGMRPQN